MQVAVALADPPVNAQCPTGSVPRMPCTTETPQPPQPIPAEATTTAATTVLGPAGRHRDFTEGELECLVCREPFSWCGRSPKLLSCQHSFCAVCLKLLLFVQGDSWCISCPLCRKVTTVPGGLICSLRDPEAVVGQLCPEVRLCPQGLEGSATWAAGQQGLAEDGEQDAASANRVAARRLAVHLLLLVLLITLILPFIYPGIIRWVLALIVTLALLMSTLFCCYPHSQGSRWPCPRTLFCREQKHSQIASIA